VVAFASACGSDVQTRAPSSPASAAMTPIADPPGPYGTSANLGAMIDAYTAGYGAAWGPAYAPHGYLVVARGGRPIVSRAFGNATLEGGGAKANDDTRFRIGSVTKQFTAVAILELDQAKKLSIADPVRKYLPELPATFDAVTLRHLLTHTSGVFDYTHDEALMSARGKPMTQARVLETFAQKPLAFAPGAEHAYSNSNYFLLGMTIERVSGLSYEQYMQQEVFGPAGMKSSSTIDAPTAPNTAVGFGIGDDDELKAVESIDMSIPFAAGAIRSTPKDLVAWDRALASHALLDDAHEKLRITPEKEDYAFGVIVEKKYGRALEWHNGGIDGFRTFFARVPELDAAVAFMSNSEELDVDKIGMAVVKMMDDGRPVDPPKERAIAPFDPAAAKAVSGEYAITDDSKKSLSAMVPKGIVESVVALTIAAENGHVSVKPVGQSRFYAYFDRDGALFTKRGKVDLVPERDAQGNVVKLRLVQGPLKIDYVKK
jgi:CubicO group peptidase (beta-lactamase class C family)